MKRSSLGLAGLLTFYVTVCVRMYIAGQVHTKVLLLVFKQLNYFAHVAVRLHRYVLFTCYCYCNVLNV